MRQTFVRKLRKSGTSLSINIPPEVIELLGVREGDIVQIDIENVKRGDQYQPKRA